MIDPEKIELKTKNGRHPAAEDIEYLCDGDWREKLKRLIKSGAPLSSLRPTREADKVFIIQKEK